MLSNKMIGTMTPWHRGMQGSYLLWPKLGLADQALHRHQDLAGAASAHHHQALAEGAPC